jgi:predicted secreted protein
MESKHSMNLTKTARTSARALALTLAFAVGLPSVLLSACASKDALPVAVAQRTIQNPGKSQVEIAEADGGAKVIVQQSQVLVVDLPLLPTEGREWSLVDMKPGVLSVVSSKFELDKRDHDGLASPGDMIIRFKPEAVGDVELNFALRRPHTLEPATKTVTFAVTVR